mmetsp:Transcript_28367/g.36695  ORF Transcript_28367/g.36695 Transcript_28367/m.36695 type:complete len:331 (-) Transcript_28367:137-1129(-)
MLAPLVITGVSEDDDDEEEDDNDSDDEEDDDIEGRNKQVAVTKETILFVKPYMMLTVLVKTGMILAAALASSRAASGAMSSNGASEYTSEQLANGGASLASTLFLFGATWAWLWSSSRHTPSDLPKKTNDLVLEEVSQNKDEKKKEEEETKKFMEESSSEFHAEWLPCKVAAANRWKLATFGAASISASISIWLLSRHHNPASSSSSSSFPVGAYEDTPASTSSQDILTAWLPMLWICFALFALSWPLLKYSYKTSQQILSDDDVDDCDSDDEDYIDHLKLFDKLTTIKEDSKPTDQNIGFYQEEDESHFLGVYTEGKPFVSHIGTWTSF